MGRGASQRLRRILAVLGAVAVSMAIGAPATAAKEPRLKARAWVLIDARDGERLAGQAAGRELPIASTTKLMTAHLALEQLPLGRRLPAPRYPAGAAESVLGLKPGERMTVRDLIYALVLQSANDAAVTLAKGVSGTQRRFVAEMNKSAQALGLTGTHYTTPVGLDAPGNYSTAADLAALARLMLEGRFFARVADSRKAVLRSGAKRRTIATRNTLELSEPSVTGVKTGHTLKAGYVLVGSASRNGIELVSAVLGARSEAARDTETRKLLDYGYSLYHRRTAAARGATVATVKIRYRGERLALVAGEPLRVTAREGQRVSTRAVAPSEVDGPIAAGAPLGRVVASIDGRVAGSVPLVAAKAVPKASLARKVASNGLLLVVLAAAGIFVIVVGLRRGRRAHRVEPAQGTLPGLEAQQTMREERRKMRDQRRQGRKGDPR